MLKKHLKKAAALLVSIATILGTLPAMAASNEAESVEKSAVSTITDNEAKELSSDDALEMLKSESQTKEVEDNAAEKEKAESLKNYLTEMNIPVTAKEYTEQNGEVELQDDTETAKEYSGSYSNETTMWSVNATVSTTDETAADYESLTVQITEEDCIPMDGDDKTEKIAMWTDLQNKIDLTQEDVRTMRVFTVKLLDSENKEVNFDANKTTVTIQSMWVGYSPDIYIYDGTTAEKLNAEKISRTVYMPEGTLESMGYSKYASAGMDSLTYQGTSKKFVYVSGFEPRENLAPGTYDVTANLTVNQRNNVFLGCNVYLTSTAFPPVAPISMNAQMEVSADGKATITIKDFSAIFVILNLSDGKDIHIKDKIMKDNDLGEGYEDVYNQRINGLTLEVDNFHGLYRFTDCKENATPFKTDVEMPIDLEVDFDSAEKGYTKPSDGETEYTKTFTDTATGSTVSVTTTEEFGTKLANATLTAKPLEDSDKAEHADVIVRKYWDMFDEDKNFVKHYKYGYIGYSYTLLDEDGNEIKLTGNSKADVTAPLDTKFKFYNPVIQEIDYSTGTLKTRLTKLNKINSGADIAFTSKTLGDFAIVDATTMVDGQHVGSAATIYNITSVGSDGTSFALCSSTGGRNSVARDPYADATALDVKKETTSIGTKYYFAYENAEEDATKANTSIWIYSSWLKAEIPTKDFEQTPNVYFVLDNGTNSSVFELDNSKVVDGRIVCDVLNPNGGLSGIDEFPHLADYYMPRRSLIALYDGYQGKAASDTNPNAYVLVTDKKIAGVPANKAQSSMQNGQYKPKSADVAYNGATQTMPLYFSSNTKSQNTSGKDAGEYTAVFTPEEGATWIDGTSEPKEMTWNIKKATLSWYVKLSKNVMALEDELPTATLDVSSYSSNTFKGEDTIENAADLVLPEIVAPDKSTFEKGGVYSYSCEGGSAKNYNFRYYVDATSKLTILQDGQEVVKAPEVIDGLKYNGKYQKLFIDGDTEKYTVEKTGSKNHFGDGVTEGKYANGSYGAKFVLKDKEHYVWSDTGTSTDKKYSVQIKRAPLTVSYESETIHVGETPKLKINYDGLQNGETPETIKADIEAFKKEHGENNSLFYHEPTLSGVPDELTPGTYEITPSFTVSNYDTTFVSGTLTVLPAEEKPTEKTITANLYVPGELNTQLPGVTAYLTNGNNPLGIGGYDKVAPTTPVKDNAKFKVVDGKMQVTVPVLNPVFTLQEIGECSNATIVDMKKDSETYATTDGSVSRTGRITEVTVQLNDNSGHYVFNKCTEFPTLLGVDWNVPLTLDVDFAAAYTVGEITVSDNTVTVPVAENYDIDAQMAVALYDENGVLIGIQSKPVNGDNVTVEETADNLAKAKKITAFVWGSTQSMNPCAEVKSKTISE